MPNVHTTLSSLFTDIANAIRGKTGGIDTIVADDFPTQIASIETGVDTSDATATASDIASGKTAYVDGEKVTGTLYEVPYNLVVVPNENLAISVGSYMDLPTIMMSAPASSSAFGNRDLIVRKDKGIYMTAYASDFGNATAADVAAGKTFTSSEGVKLTGTATSSGLVTLSVKNSTGVQLEVVTDQGTYQDSTGSATLTASCTNGASFAIFAWESGCVCTRPTGITQEYRTLFPMDEATAFVLVITGTESSYSLTVS